jgi:hypothetical protein
MQIIMTTGTSSVLYMTPCTLARINLRFRMLAHGFKRTIRKSLPELEDGGIIPLIILTMPMMTTMTTTRSRWLGCPPT